MYQTPSDTLNLTNDINYFKYGKGVLGGQNNLFGGKGAELTDSSQIMRGKMREMLGDKAEAEVERFSYDQEKKKEDKMGLIKRKR